MGRPILGCGSPGSENVLNLVGYKITQIPNEGNKVARTLAQQGCMTENIEVFNHDTAPRMILSMVRMDQLGLPNFRFNFLTRIVVYSLKAFELESRVEWYSPECGVMP